MKKSGILSLVFLATAFLGLGARPASALICCSACDANPDLLACRHGCSPSCVIDEEPIAPDHVVYDDVDQVCYRATNGDASIDAPALTLK